MLTLFHSSTYVILDQYTVVASCVTKASSDILLLDLSIGSYRSLGLPFCDLALHKTGVFRVSRDRIAILGSTTTTSKQLSLVSNVHSNTSELTVVQSTMNIVTTEYVSTAKHLEVDRTTREGRLHVFYFPPHHARYQGPLDAAPPGLIHLHGGPNGCTSQAFDLSIQFWTTRGFAVCAINYSGSVGFGRKYREELTGHWGLLDVQDTYDAVRYLGQHKYIDSKRVGIYGGSAGGYGTLSAIHMFPDIFAAAVSSYGISDIQALQVDTYKFESHDVERLVLSLCAEDDAVGRAELYKQRSPRYHAHRITAPLLILQGTSDKAVPPEQAHIMADEMRRRGRTVRVVEFDGEGHGWMKEDTILRAYQEQEAWWKAYLGDGSS